MRGSLAILMLAATAVSASAQPVKYSVTPASSVTVDGTSNIHAWHASSSELTTSIVVASPVSAASQVESVTLTLPVTSLKSGRGGLDKNLYKAMRADEHPTISFTMQSYRAEPAGDSSTATVTGLLTVNGVEKEITARAVMRGDGKEGLTATGSTTFRMTDFGIKPVTALFGTIRTGDEITVRFELIGAPARAVAGLPR